MTTSIQIGDRVRVNTPNDNLFNGKEGIIADIVAETPEKCCRLYLVDMGFKGAFCVDEELEKVTS